MPKADTEHTDIVWVRVDGIIKLILENDRYLQSKRNKELCNIVMTQFSISIRTAQRYIGEAKKEIRKLGQKDKNIAFTKAIRDREFLYMKAISPSFIFNKDLRDDKGNLILVADLKLALEVAKDRDKLNGLYIDELNINANVNTKPDLSKLTIEELRALAQFIRDGNKTPQ